MTDLSLPAKRSFDLEDALLRFAQDWRASALIAAAAVLQQAIGHLNGDDSWFLTFAEKYLGGAVPYVDIFDPNPPAAFLAYVPAVALGRIFGAPPEFFVAILTFLGAGLALLLTGEILLYGACWLLTIVVWSTSAGYAFLQAPRRFSPGRAMGGA